MNENIKLVANNIRELVEGPFFIEQYRKFFHNSEDIEGIKNEDNYELISRCEEYAAGIFNNIFIICQLEYDIEKIKRLVEERIDSCAGKLTSLDLEYDILKRLSEIDDYYKENTKEKMIDRLKHGFAVHFTTSQIANIMNKDGEFRPYGGIFTPEERKIISEAHNKQFNNLSEDENHKYYRYSKCLDTGFGISNGISMSAQTNGYWMYHTPEALSFLYGGNVTMRDKDGAMKHIESCTDTLEQEEREAIKKMLEKTWDRVIGKEEKQAAVLIPRDALEYEKVTYWNEKPPRVEEIRPFRNNSFQSIEFEEETRYTKPIDANKLFFVKVPTVRALNRQLDFEVLKEQKDSRLSLLKNSANSKYLELKSLQELENELGVIWDEISLDALEEKGGGIDINE